VISKANKVVFIQRFKDLGLKFFSIYNEMLKVF